MGNRTARRSAGLPAVLALDERDLQRVRRAVCVTGLPVGKLPTLHPMFLTNFPIVVRLARLIVRRRGLSTQESRRKAIEGEMHGSLFADEPQYLAGLRRSVERRYPVPKRGLYLGLLREWGAWGVNTSPPAPRTLHHSGLRIVRGRRKIDEAILDAHNRLTRL
jgi:hypothetical protein